MQAEAIAVRGIEMMGCEYVQNRRNGNRLPAGQRFADEPIWPTKGIRESN